MTTTKKAIKFYAAPEVEQHLDTMPSQTRTAWINKVLAEAVAKEQKRKRESEIEQLRNWLQSQEKAPPLYEAVADMLDAYLAG